MHAPRYNPSGEAFCCDGCLKVHGLLYSRGWGRYNDLLDQEGKLPPRAHLGEEYQTFLRSIEEPGLLTGLGRWDGTRHALTLESRDITCAACGWLLENLIQAMPAVRAFTVDFLHGEVFVDYDSASGSLAEILAELAGFGYRLRPKADTEDGRPAPDRTLLYRLAVSGACFANAMAFSVGVYLGAFRGMDPAWLRVFGLLGLAVSLPAVTYCAYPFFSGAWRAFQGGYFSVDVTVSIGILLAFLLSAISALGGGTGNFTDSLTGLVFFLLVGRWAVRRFEAGLALKGRWFDGLRPGRVRVRRDGETVFKTCEEVREGEIIELMPGEYAPLDGILESPRVSMDTGLLTGESRAVSLRRGDPVFAGFQNLRERAALRVTGTLGNTRIARLGRELETLTAGRRGLPDATGAVAKWFTVAVALCGLLAFALRLREGVPAALAAAASVFIISCSCALALAAPINRGLGLKRARTLGFHFRSQDVLESLKHMRCVLFDKTGTLTFTRRTLTSWEWMPAFRSETSQANALKQIKALVRHSLHPVSVSLHHALETLDPWDEEFTRVREIPHFGLVGQGRGARGVEVCLCRYGAWEEDAGAFATLGYGRPVLPPHNRADACVFLDGCLAALIRFTDEIKPEVPELVAALRRRGIAVALLSGDNLEKVEGFARACGIEDFHAALTPEAKRDWAVRYRSHYGPCLAVGDGFNDSLLFGAADAAMAIQGGAVDLSAGTDILSTGTHPADLDRLFALAIGVRRGITASFWVSGFYNAAALAVAVQGLVTPLMAAVLMPVSSISLCLAAWLAIPGAKRGGGSEG